MPINYTIQYIDIHKQCPLSDANNTDDVTDEWDEGSDDDDDSDGSWVDVSHSEDECDQVITTTI